MTVALAVTVIGLGSALSQDRGSVRSSLLLLIDASGSMGDAIGGGNSEVKIEAAKRAAADALSRAAGGGSVEVAVLAFSGDCQNPVPRYQDFTRDVDWLTRFIERLQPGGGTPMADALLFANRYMAANGSDGASDRMIMLLAGRPERLRRHRQRAGYAPGERRDLPSRDGGLRHNAQLGGGRRPAPNCDTDRRRLPPCRRRQPARGRVHGVRGHTDGD